MEGFLALGFLIGTQHALKADHLAAVGTLSLGAGHTKRSLALRGAAWGLGHAITLFAICAAVILLGLSLTEQTAAAFKFAVGVMLVLLGFDVIRRMRARRPVIPGSIGRINALFPGPSSPPRSSERWTPWTGQNLGADKWNLLP